MSTPPTAQFPGKIGRTREESTPHWPQPQAAPAGAPNIVILYMDDMGWSDPGCYGSEIETPNLDRLAARGLRFTNYTTHPICSPARAALLTGMNAHSVGTGWLANNNAGFPGYTGEIPLDAATLAETLRERGYSTLMTGKWHNTPTPDSLPGSRKDQWPTQRGFESFYGFMEGETSFFFPSRLMLNNALVDIDAYPAGYYSTDDWTRQAIGFLRDLHSSPARKPFFLYMAQNAMHAPLQAKEADIAKYRGRYDAGWDETRAARYRRQVDMRLLPAGTRLAASDAMTLPWARTDPADRALYARHMEVYAAMLDCVDQNVGRLTTYLEAIGELDNTIIVFSSDNGGTHAGGPTGSLSNNRRFNGLPYLPPEIERAGISRLGSGALYPLYPTGWGEVSNTPFPNFKTYTGAGGRRVSFIVSWPERIKDGGTLRTQFAHVTDVMPTLLDLAGVAPLTQIRGAPARPMHGVSQKPMLLDPGAPDARTEQYYECWSNRGFYREGWFARSLQKRGEPVDFDNWTLHDLRADFSESVDVRGAHPDKLEELVEAFDRAAWANTVYPLDNRSMLQKLTEPGRPRHAAADAPRRFEPGGQTVHRAIIAALVSDRNFRVVARIAQGVADEGVLWSIGDVQSGMVLSIEGGALNFCYVAFGAEVRFAATAIGAGEHEIVLDYAALGARKGRGRLLLNGMERVTWTELSPTLQVPFHEGLDIGIDRRGPVDWALYQRRGVFRYAGTVREVLIEPGKRPE